MGAYEDFIKSYEESSFVEKIKFIKNVKSVMSNLCLGVSRLMWDGYLGNITKHEVRCSSGEYYVYLWRHAWGDPFYVGSGKNTRWIDKRGRCDDFYLHLDQADAVIYKVLDGVDSKTARLFEKYVSVNLVEGGYTLANGDNNTEYMTDDARQRRVDSCKEIDKHELASKVQKAVLDILYDDPECDYFITDKFIMEYGADYFSRNYIGKRRYVCDFV